MDKSNIIKLYHGSKKGINGKIRPVSRANCDFGKGFYMGTEKYRPLTLICNFPNASIYTVELDLDGLKILNLEIDIEWAMFVAYNRGKMDSAKNTDIYKKYSALSEGYDLIIGYIANDRMFYVLDRFFAGDITDIALISSLAALNLGKQYVAVTQKACDRIKITSERRLSEFERKELILLSGVNRENGISKANEICREHRRDGLYFDEILKGRK